MSFLGPSVIQGHVRAGVSLSGPLPCGGTRAPTYHHPSAPSSSSSFSVFSARRGNSVASSSSSSAPLSSSSLLNRGSSSFGASLGAVSISRRTSSCCAASSSAASSTSASASSDSASAAENENVENVVIVGSGPAGYTAAIYASRASLRPLMFEGVSAGGVPGGQLMTTTEVENFPGFPEGITGPDLMERMRKQAERWGADLLTEDVVSIDLNGGTPPFRITGTDTEVLANAVIVATGATAKRLGLPSEHTFWSRGISACAICDGASPIFKRKPVAVVGGGDTALEEALYLTKYASKVYLLVRSSMRASMTMQERVKAHPDIEILTNVTCDDVLGDPKTGAMNAVRVVPTDGNGDSRTISISGMFYGIGHTPNSAVLNGQVDLDEAGYVSVTDGCRTSMPGVFCAGDLHDTEWRQAITAAGSGCMAAIATERYLAENDLLVEVKSVPTPAQQEAQKVASANKAAAEDTQELVEESKETFDIAQTYHKGQFALRKLYHESPRSIVKVLYTSPTCGPCRALKPILRKAVADIDEMDSNGVHFVEIDIEADPEIAEAAGVTGTPTVHIFKEKARVEVMTGVKGKSEYKKVMAEHIGLEIDTTSKIGVSR